MRLAANKKQGLAVTRGPLIGMAVFAVLSFVVAHLAEQGILSVETAGPAMHVILLLASLFAGAFSGGAGKRGLLTGCILMILYLIAKAAFHWDAFFDAETLFGLLCILPGAWLGSCIFHKKRGCYTKRNRKNHRRNYK